MMRGFFMMTVLYKLGLAAAAAVLYVTVAVDSATASSGGAASLPDNRVAIHKQVQQGIDDVLRRTPGARQIDPTTILVAPGVVMKFPDPNATKSPDLEEYCSQENLCLFNNVRYNVGTSSGHQLNLYTCGHEVNLGRVAFPGGGYWNDKVSSMINNQIGSNVTATSYFYNYAGSSNVWNKVFDMPPQTHRTDLRIDHVNDIIDGVHVCGPVPSPWGPNYP